MSRSALVTLCNFVRANWGHAANLLSKCLFCRLTSHNAERDSLLFTRQVDLSTDYDVTIFLISFHEKKFGKDIGLLSRGRCFCHVFDEILFIHLM